MGTVERTFQIVEEVVAHQERGLSFSEVVSRTHLPKASAHRILKALVHVGYLRFDEEGSRYYGDLRLSRLGSEVTAHFDLKGYVRPRLLRLHTETGPGVYETAIRYDDLERAGDAAALFKTAVKEICARHGVMPCFMAKWNKELPGCSGHLHQSLWTLSGQPAFHESSSHGWPRGSTSPAASAVLRPPLPCARKTPEQSGQIRPAAPHMGV